MRHLNLFSALAAASCLYCGAASAVADELPADIVTGLLPLTAYGIAHFKEDDEGQRQFLRSTAASLVVNTTLRVAFNETSWGERPNGSPYGFPSGHTGFVTSSAAFLQDRYGWKYGLPAYAVVGYVGWARVDSNHHKWRDIIAGAAVSMGISKLFVTPDGAAYLAPVIGPDFLGMRWERSF